MKFIREFILATRKQNFLHFLFYHKSSRRPHSSPSAKNKQYLRLMGITHVLNTAEGSRLGQVDTGHGYYRDMPNLRWAFNLRCWFIALSALSLSHHGRRLNSRWFISRWKFRRRVCHSFARISSLILYILNMSQQLISCWKKGIMLNLAPRSTHCKSREKLRSSLLH